ncbi:unnamed protein product, partial [Prunus brigantina]
EGGLGLTLFTGIVSALAKSKFHFQQLPWQGGYYSFFCFFHKFPAFGLELGLPLPSGQPRLVDPPAFVAGTCIWALAPPPARALGGCWKWPK